MVLIVGQPVSNGWVDNVEEHDLNGVEDRRDEGGHLDEPSVLVLPPLIQVLSKQDEANDDAQHDEDQDGIDDHCDDESDELLDGAEEEFFLIIDWWSSDYTKESRSFHLLFIEICLSPFDSQLELFTFPGFEQSHRPENHDNSKYDLIDLPS